MKCVDTAERCAKAAAEHGVKRWVEVSTAQVYKPDKAASTESAPIKPWTTQANKRLEAEQRVQKTPGLQWVILRPAIVYGTGDLTGLSQLRNVMRAISPLCSGQLSTCSYLPHKLAFRLL